MNEQHFNNDDFTDYLHGELSPGRDAEMLVHLDACATCRTAYDAEARLGETLRAYAALSEREMPAGLAAGVWGRIEREREGPRWATRLAALLRPAIAIPVAAALVLAAYLGSTLQHGSAKPSIDAAYYLNDHAALTRTIPFSEGGSVVPPTLASDNAGADQQAIVIAGSMSGPNGSP